MSRSRPVAGAALCTGSRRAAAVGPAPPILVSCRCSLTIPTHLLPADGRFGSGPSKVRPAQVDHLAAHADLLGTSHRQAPVKALVRRIRAGGRSCSACPTATRSRSATAARPPSGTSPRSASSSARSTRRSASSAASSPPPPPAPRSSSPPVISAAPGSVACPSSADGVDTYAWPHNETSTGVVAPCARPGLADTAPSCSPTRRRARAACPSTSPRPTSTTSPRRSRFAADGGLWLAVPPPPRSSAPRGSRSTAAGCRSSCRSRRRSTNSRQDQTLNTPAVATLVLLADQVEWLIGQGGLGVVDEALRDVGRDLYAWAEARDGRRRSCGPGAALHGRRHDRPRPARSTRPRWPPCCAPTASWTCPLPQARAQPAPRRDVPRGRPRRRRALTACVDYLVDRLG